VSAEVELPGPFWLIGCGNMAGAMLQGWLAAGIDARQVTVIDPYLASAPEGVRLVQVPPEDEVPALVLLGVKPQKLDEAAPALAPALDPNSIIISILAGTELASLHARFPNCPRIIRAMPNTPVRLRKGAIGLHAAGVDEAARSIVEKLMRRLGQVEWIDQEPLLDAVTALSGSGPAFLFRFIDALAKAGAAAGLDPDQAGRLALATVEGAAALAAAADDSPAALAEKVASPGGSTRRGLDVLDQDQKLVQLLIATLAAAVERNREMAAEARTS
jgi:pyrroline-5-carboxylate reductase